MVRHLIHFFIAIALISGSSVFAEEKKQNWESIVYGGFKTVEKFRVIEVSLEGSAQKVGLTKEELTDYLRLRFKNSFAGMEFKEPENLFETFQGKEKDKTNGSILVKVWTVGDDYPIAYHIGIMAGNLTNLRIYEAASLGYGSKQNVPDSIRKSISQLIDDLAVDFFKARGEL